MSASSKLPQGTRGTAKILKFLICIEPIWQKGAVVLSLLLAAGACAFAAFGHCAEIAVKVGDGARYLDGDIVQVFTDKRISTVHAEMITHPWRAGLTAEGLRPDDSLSRLWKETMVQYHFQRISPHEVRRTEILTGESKVFSEVPDPETKEHIYAEEYIQRRLEHPGHVIFGKKGREEWFGGYRRITQEKLDFIWRKIEEQTGLRQEDHTQWPFSGLEKSHFLILDIGPLTDEEAEALQSLVYDKEEEFEDREMIFKRRYTVPYWEILSPETVRAIRDKSQAVDLRKEQTFKIEEIVQDKLLPPGDIHLTIPEGIYGEGTPFNHHRSIPRQ